MYVSTVANPSLNKVSKSTNERSDKRETFNEKSSANTPNQNNQNMNSQNTWDYDFDFKNEEENQEEMINEYNPS